MYMPPCQNPMQCGVDVRFLIGEIDNMRRLITDYQSSLLNKINDAESAISGNQTDITNLTTLLNNLSSALDTLSGEVSYRSKDEQINGQKSFAQQIIAEGGLKGNVIGDVVGNVNGNVTGDLTGNVTGNLAGKASSASQADNATLANEALVSDKLKTAVNIGGVKFDGTQSIDLAGVNTIGNQDTTGNANTATMLRVGDAQLAINNGTLQFTTDGTNWHNVSLTN